MAKKMPRTQKFHQDEEKICGIHAAQKAYLKRGHKIAKVYVDQERLPVFSEILKFCAQNKIGYKAVASNELTKISGSDHHEGICLCLKKAEPLELDDQIHRLSRKEKVMILALHQAQNPHNIGAIMRVAAHFGVDLILLETDQKKLSPSTYRIAEGGAEYVPVVFVVNLKDTLSQLKDNQFQIYATSSHQSGNLYQTKFSQKSVIVMGKEDHGLPENILKLGTPLSIPGTGFVESLNLSSATSILLSEFRRQQPLNGATK